VKNIYTISLIFIFICNGLSTNAQTSADSVHIEGYIPVSRVDEAKWIKRHQKDMDRYVEENGKMTDFSCDALFLGSSSINLWHNIHNDLAPLKIIKRSYGGSTIRDNIYNYSTIAREYNPKMVTIYIENDLGKSKEAITPGELYDLFRLFIQMIHRDYPNAKIFIISLKPSFAKYNQLEDQLIVNRLLHDYAKQTKYVEYIDITKGMYDDNGKLREDIFVEDRLHMNEKGYKSWIEEIKPCLLNEIKDNKE
jgi:lysophospholipase L1-like esterase